MISRTLLTRGPGYVTLNGVVIRAAGDIKAFLKWETDTITDTLAGPFTKVVKNRWVEIQFAPLYYDPTVTIATIFPYLTQATTPMGFQCFGTSDVAATVVSNGGDKLTVVAAAVTQMPTITLGVDKPVFGEMTITGVCGTGLDPSTASSFYTMDAVTYAAPSIPSTSVLGRQKYTAAWGTISGFTSFQAYEGFMIDHKLELNWDLDNGQRIGASLAGYLAGCKCKPAGPTMANVGAAAAFQSTHAAQGQRLDATATSSDLVISGAASITVTVKGAAIDDSIAFEYGAKPLRQGEVQWVSTLANTSGVYGASLVLA